MSLCNLVQFMIATNPSEGPILLICHINVMDMLRTGNTYAMGQYWATVQAENRQNRLGQPCLSILSNKKQLAGTVIRRPVSSMVTLRVLVSLVHHPQFPLTLSLYVQFLAVLTCNWDQQCEVTGPPPSLSHLHVTAFSSLSFFHSIQLSTTYPKQRVLNNELKKLYPQGSRKNLGLLALSFPPQKRHSYHSGYDGTMYLYCLFAILESCEILCIDDAHYLKTNSFFCKLSLLSQTTCLS